MCDRRDDFAPGTEIAVVMFTAGDLPDPGVVVLRDPGRRAYRAFGFGRGSVRRVWGLRALRRYVEIVAREGFRRLRRPTEDTLQLGGDVVVAADGTIAYVHRGRGPDDRPPVDDLVAASRSDPGGARR